MKHFGKLGGVILLLVFAGKLLSWHGDKQTEKAQQQARQKLEQTRTELRRAGYKIDLAEFVFTTPEATRRRMTVLTNAGASFQFGWSIPRWAQIHSNGTEVILWQIQSLPRYVVEGGYLQVTEEMTNAYPHSLEFYQYQKQDIWPEIRTNLLHRKTRLDEARDAILTGPIQFEPIRPGPEPLLPYLSYAKTVSDNLATRFLWQMHENQTAEAASDWRAVTRLATAWTPEPLVYSHLVRFACAGFAFDTAWQALQFDAWDDAVLASQQREWEAADFFQGLAETAAWNRASKTALLQNERATKLDDLTGTWQDQGQFLRSSESWRHPISTAKSFWEFASARRQMAAHQRVGSYEDEVRLLRHFCDREKELKTALALGDWSQMKPLPGVTNRVDSSSLISSRVQALMNLQELAFGFQAQGKTLLMRAAEIEAKRRLVVTALALARHHRRHGFYPENLPALTPEFLEKEWPDFMSGKSLRYRLEKERFTLYSIGLDGVDDGGRPLPRPKFGQPSSHGDLVWPQPAANRPE